MDVAGWLRSLGLGQDEEAFRDNDIEGEVLPHLTADDLMSIGVTSGGSSPTASFGRCRSGLGFAKACGGCGAGGAAYSGAAGGGRAPSAHRDVL